VGIADAEKCWTFGHQKFTLLGALHILRSWRCAASADNPPDALVDRMGGDVPHSDGTLRAVMKTAGLERILQRGA